MLRDIMEKSFTHVKVLTLETHKYLARALIESNITY